MHSARNLSEQRVVFADADIFSGHDLGAALAHDDLADPHFLTVSAFNPEILRI